MRSLIKRICCALVVVAMGVVFTGCSSLKEQMGFEDGVTVNIDDADVQMN